VNYIEQEVVLKTRGIYGADIPLALSSALLRGLEHTARPSVRMALEGTSASAGAPPTWLERASDIRTLGFSGRGEDTILHLKAPKLGDAAPKLFEQPSLWPSGTSPDDTAVQVMGKIAAAVRRQESGSDLYDGALLKRFGNWSALFKHHLNSVNLRTGFDSDAPFSPLDGQVVASARLLSDQTPSPRQVRLVGNLDMIRHSTRSFGLLLADGAEVRGVLVDRSLGLLQDYLGKDITVLGKAIYRPSGTLLRVDASEIAPGSEGRQAFSKVPSSLQQARRTERRLQTSRSGVVSFFGSWPGEETDGDLLRALEEVRS
jgi:hypothetical protein